MDMDIHFFIEVRIQPQFLSPGADVGKGCLGTLFHYISQLAGQDQFAFAFADHHFDLQQFTAHAGPCQTSADPYF